MIRLTLWIFLLCPSLVWAGGLPVLAYQSISCRLSKEDQVVKEMSSSLMTLTIEDHLGRFAQFQLGDEELKIQYQILIEDDASVKTHDSVLVLQNLLVGSVESSSEVSARDLTWLRIRQGDYSVDCDLKKNID